MEDQFKESVPVNTEKLRQNVAWTMGPREFIMKYLRFFPWILFCATLGLMFAYIKIRYSTPIYHVQSSMLIKKGEDNRGTDPRFSQLFMGPMSSNLSNEVQILKSSPIVQRVVRDIDFQTRYYGKGKIKSSLLYDNSPFELKIIHQADSNGDINLKVTVLNDNQFLIDQIPSPISFGEQFDINGRRLSLTRNKAVDLRGFSSPEFQIIHTSVNNVAMGLMGGLRIVSSSDETTILTLSFDGENTSLGIDVLNTLMSVYDTLIIEDKNRIAKNTLIFIDNQLNILKGQLADVEGKTKGFMVNNNVFDISNQSKTYLDNIEESSKLAATQEIKLSVLNLLLDYLGNTKNGDKLVPTNLGIEEPALSQMVFEYNRMQLQREANLKTTTPQNPLIRDLDANLEKLRTGMIQALKNVKQSYAIASKNLEQQTEMYKARLKSIPGQNIQLLNIQRQQKILEDLFSFLLMKKLETSMSLASTVSNSEVIEPAKPTGEIISPNKKGIYTFYLLVAIMIPVGLIFLIELLKDKVSGRVDVENRTQVPILGEIGHSYDDQALVVTQNSRRLIAEQFRIIRSNLQYVVKKKEKTFILVTSSFSGEGKSFVSTNMGAVMALTGQKTVIMEYDIRKPKIVAGLDLKRKMGITNYIIGKAKFEELILPVQGVDNLYVIPCGPIPPNPSELLLDSRVDELMAEVRKHFDVIIMDTAPAGLVGDAINLSKYADCTFYIVRQGHTFRKQIGLIESMYVEKKLPSISIVLNDVKMEGGYYGGYYGGYGYYSGYGYGLDSGYFDEDASGRKTKKSMVRRLILWLKRKIF